MKIESKIRKAKKKPFREKKEDNSSSNLSEIVLIFINFKFFPLFTAIALRNLSEIFLKLFILNPKTSTFLIKNTALQARGFQKTRFS